MAATNLRSAIQQEHLTCTICFGVFTNPKALPCLHTFCEHCLREYIASRGFEPLGEFTCPVCRVTVAIPTGGVCDFQDNHLVTSLSDTVVNQTYSGGDVSSLPTTSTAHGGHSMPHSPSEVTGSNANSSPKLVLKFGQKGPGVHDLHKPFGLAVTKQCGYVISDLGGNRIIVFDHCGKLKTAITSDYYVKDVAVNRRNEILAVVNAPAAAFQQFDEAGRYVLGEYGRFITHEDPCGIAVLDSGGVIVTGKQNYNVYVFTDQYKYSSKFGRKGTGNGHFHSPGFVATDRKNNVIVSDDQNDNIQVFNSQGKFKLRFGRSGSKPGEFVKPLGVATDKNDNIFVADSGNCRVEMFTAKGKHIGTIVSGTHQLGEDVRPVNVAVTPVGNVAVLLLGASFAEVRVYSPIVRSPASVKNSSAW